MMTAEALSLLMWMNLALAVAVVLVLPLRATMRAWFGARVAYSFWWIVAAAMLAALLPARTVQVTSENTATHAVESSRAAANGELQVQSTGFALIDPSTVLLSLWLTGVVAMLVVMALRQRAFVASLGRLSREADGTLRAETSGVGPAILGALSPKLVLPKDFEKQFDPAERDLILAHERVHLRRGDTRINGLMALARCVCWFNPLVHVAAFAMRIDQELACDAAVAAQYPKARRIYAEAMLKTQLTQMSLPIGCLWPASDADPLSVRIAALKHELPGTRRVAAGSLLAALACLTTGCTVWAAHPPREVEAKVTPISSMPGASDAQLLRAARSGNFRRAEAAIVAGADVNVRSSSGLTALVIAARADDIRMLNLLLDHGADVNLMSQSEGNALVAAGRRGHVRSVAALVEHGAQVNVIVPAYGTPLVASVRTGHRDVVQYLVEHGADVNLASPAPAPWDRWAVMRTPLAVAVAGDHTSTAVYLRAMGAEMQLVTR